MIDILVCAELAFEGVHFAVENPLSSYAFRTELFQCLTDLTNVVVVDLDQCCYGLNFFECERGSVRKKPTRIVGTSRAFQALHLRCPGTRPDHRQVRTWGNVRADGKTRCV